MMDGSRRSFLKIGGLSVLGLSGVRVWNVFAATQEAGHEAAAEAVGVLQWAMVIDMKKCWDYQEKQPCTDCMTACHGIHNVPEIADPKREIKWLWTDLYQHAFPTEGHEYPPAEAKGKPFLLLCNHCSNPPCVRVCPTQATFKRPEDGVVMMDFHRCIGCRYCMAGCPYGSRSFNWQDPRPFIKELNMQFPTRTKGVVEKCNFCAERLAKNLYPACVEVCKAKALTFGNLGDPTSPVRELLKQHYTIRRKNELGTGPNVYYIV